MSKPWIPEKESLLVAMCMKWNGAFTTEGVPEGFQWNPALCEPVSMKITVYLNAVGAFAENDSSANRLARNTAKKDVMKAMREFANSSIRYNPFMTDADRQEMGLPSVDSVPTPHPRPTSMPDTVAENTAYHLQHRVRARNVENGRATKPAGVYGVRFAWQVGGERPATGGAMSHGRFSRRPEVIVMFEETDRGKMVYYASCYENAKGEAGPWSLVVEAYIG